MRCPKRFVRVTDAGGARRSALRRAGFAALVGAALLLTGVGRATAAESLERLFFTPLERQMLDEARESPTPPPAPSGRKTEAPPVVDVISFDGKVERSDGLSTVWVNGRAVFTGDRTAEGIRIEAARGTAGEARFELPPPDSDSGAEKRPPPFTLKVGQKVAVQNGRKFDAYEARPDEDTASVFSEAGSAESSSDARQQSPTESVDGGGKEMPPASGN